MGEEHDDSPSMACVQAEGCLVLDEAEQVGRGQTLQSGRPCEEFGFYFFVCSGSYRRVLNQRNRDKIRLALKRTVWLWKGPQLSPLSVFPGSCVPITVV